MDGNSLDRDDATGDHRLSPRLILGLAIMAFGLLWTLDNLGLLEARDWLRYWPLLLIAGGLARMSGWRQREGRPEGLILVVIGSLILIHNLHLLHMRQVWPLLLLAVGAGMVWKAIVGPRRGVARAPDDENRLHAVAILGGVQRATSTQDFQGGDATAVLGGCMIDLRKAQMRDDSAGIDLFAFWGGVELRVPEDWAVDNRGLAILGGMVDNTRRPLDPKKRLVLSGMAIMGGIEVKN